MTTMERDHWIMRIVDRMDRFYSSFFKEGHQQWIEENYFSEGWQTSAMAHGFNGIFPTIRLNEPKLIKGNAKYTGGLLGHSVAHYYNLCDPERWAMICRLLSTLRDRSPNHESSKSSNDLPAKQISPFVAILPDFNKALSCCMRDATEQSQPEQIQFFEGYAKALRKGALDKSCRGVGDNTRTRAYQAIAFLSPVISKNCRTVSDVHKMLVKVLGSNMAGDLKRTEDICKRIRLKFRAPGRPKE